MQDIVTGNIKLREQAADRAENLINDLVKEYIDNGPSLEALDTLLRFRKHHENLKQVELEKALTSLAKGDDPKAIIKKLANQLTNKIIHNPSLKIKEAGTIHGEELLKVIDSIFLLEDQR